MEHRCNTRHGRLHGRHSFDPLHPMVRRSCLSVRSVMSVRSNLNFIFALILILMILLIPIPSRSADFTEGDDSTLSSFTNRYVCLSSYGTRIFSSLLLTLFLLSSLPLLSPSPYLLPSLNLSLSLSLAPQEAGSHHTTLVNLNLIALPSKTPVGCRH
jgi:hypothetical protein